MFLGELVEKFGVWSWLLVAGLLGCWEMIIR